MAILDFWNTPTQVFGTSPAQRLVSRRTRTLLALKRSLLKPKVVTDAPKEIKEEQSQAV